MTSTATRRSRPVADLLERRPLLIGVILAVAFMLLSISINDLNRGLEWDEAEYMSEALGFMPGVDFGSHRARGIVWLVTPLNLLGVDWAIGVRLWMLMINVVAVGIAGWIWARLVGISALIGGLIFGTMWLTIIYTAEVSPNLPSALLLVAGTGATLLGLRTPGTRGSWVVGSIALFAAASVIRPTDSVWWGLGLALGLLLARLPFFRAFWPMGTGITIGLVPWLVEAQARFGGPIERLRAAAQVVDSGTNSQFIEYARLLDGPLAGPDRLAAIPWPGVVYLLILMVLSGVALVVADSAYIRKSVLVLLASGAATAVSYLFVTGALAPRFLFPFFAALAMAAGVAVVSLWRSPGIIRIAAVAVGISLLAGTMWQIVVAIDVNRVATLDRGFAEAVASNLVGSGPAEDCFVASQYGFPQLQVYSGCNGSRLTPSMTELPDQIQQGLDAGAKIYILFWSEPSPNSPVRTWPWTTFRYGSSDILVFVPPSA